MSFKSFKRKIGIALYKTPFANFLSAINLAVFHRNVRLRYLRKDKTSTKYLLIKASDNAQGILSLFLYVLNCVVWAEKNGFVPYVDFSDNNCQYYTGREIGGTHNAWEYFFTQPSTATMEDINKSGCVLRSGWSFKKKYKMNAVGYSLENMDNPEIKKIVETKLKIREDLLSTIEQKHRELFDGKVLGVFIRGTDYVQIRPKGHYVQPTIEQTIQKIDEFLSKHEIDKIFVVTEDYSYFEKLKNTYGSKVFSSDEYFIKDYKKGHYVAECFDNDEYERGLNYLTRILLLNKCDYLISSITNGSLFSRLYNDKPFADEYWFELGRY